MSSTTSFSQGCFVFKGSQPKSGKAPRKKARKSSESEVEHDANSVLLFSKADKPSTETRLDVFRKTWKKIEKESEKIISESHQQLLSDITSFVNHNGDTNQSSIPTALVALGVNLPDHGAFFSLLDSTLKASSSPFVAMLSSKECPSLKHMVLKVVQKLTNLESVDDEDVTIDEESEEEVVKKPSKPTKHKTFAHLVAWYSNVVIKTPLIVILEDLESFGTQQLQDFVLLCREYRVRQNLPIQFVMGIATTAALQQQLHHRTSVCLATKSFQSQPSVVLLNHLVEKLFMKDSIVKIGPRLMQPMLDAFLYHDLSLSSFMQRIHLIVMQHYITLPVASLCCPVIELSARIKQLGAADLDLYRQLPSFMKFIESNKSNVSLLTDDKEFRQFLLKSLQAVADYSKEFALHCRALHSLSEGMPDALFGKTLREVYVNLLAGGGSDDWQQFTRLLGLSSSHELRSRMEGTLAAVRACENGMASAISSNLTLFLEELRRLEEAPPDADACAASPNAESSNMFATQGKKLDKFELKARLKATAKQAKPASKFDEIRAEIVGWLNSIFAEKLKPPSTLTFHEIFYAGSQLPTQWDIVPWMRRQIQPVPRLAISKALSNPAAYLGCNCCSANGQESTLVPTMPDLCVAYKLHTECGRLINLYDWMVSFNSVYAKDSEDESEDIDPIVQARFIRAVAQLQLLGFVQSSKRKTDHVARLTWGV